ncbi:hypothetical protein A5753_21340 [Mycobacterium sp. 852002-51971_SCH5477799-a]|uniref:hypothetical protein n=1 Tax=Mycobacterium sp. 852002-51971_SCH5477799-a TaxID=1834106 RepID=UPI0007FC9B9A|nr:hypothetical protein [Mycobacterium sp. 852002-51971_SCH5477799-a]OBF69609.1 hypothetical protein A5753_21340 [Mycobacterium sp. 852002-51971_SCH5477799-a]
MKYTEIPTHLLDEATNLLPRLGYLYEQADFSADVALTVTAEEMFRLMPLVRWLEYFESTTWVENARRRSRRELDALAARSN